VFEPPFADEDLAARFDLLTRRRVDHVVVIRGDLVMQALGRVREKVPMLVDRAALDRHAVPDGGDGVWSKYWSEASISSIENLIALITVPVPHRRPG